MFHIIARGNIPFRDFSLHSIYGKVVTSLTIANQWNKPSMFHPLYIQYNTSGGTGGVREGNKKTTQAFFKRTSVINRILEYACSGGTIFCLVFTGCYYQCRLGRQIQWFLLLWYQRFEENFKIISKFSKLARSYISVWLFLR